MTDTFTIEEWNRTMKMYSIEQIEAACALAYGTQFDTSAFIGKLTRTQWNPVNGELVHQTHMEDDVVYTDYFIWDNHGLDNTVKILSITPDEVPAWKRDKECLEIAREAMDKSVFHHNIMWIQTARDKIKELTDE